MENNYLFADDMLDINEKPIVKELLENMPIPQKGSVISGTFGTFSISEFEKILKQKAESYNTIADYLCDEPISVAQTLISAKRGYELSEEEKQRSGLEKGYYHFFDVSELRQIAKHLLVYCDHNGEAEE